MHYKLIPSFSEGGTGFGAAAVVFLAVFVLATPGYLDVAASAGGSGGDTPSTDSTRVSKPIYLIVDVAGNGASTEDLRNLTDHLIGELKSHMDGQRIRPVKEGYWSVGDRQCPGNKACEVVKVEIVKLAGVFQYKVDSRLLKAPAGTSDDPILKPPRTCQVDPLESPFDLHDSYIRQIAGLLVSHDNVSHP